MITRPLTLHPDRALPAEPAVREIARQLYQSVAELPIVSMHGHIPAALLDADEAFGNPAEVLVVPDHYLVRMLLSQGVSHDAMGVPRRDGGPVESDPREIWRRFAENWHLFRGTPTRYWLEHVLVTFFGVTEQLSAATSDKAYDTISEVLARPDSRPLSLLDRFGIEILATTDSAASTLPHHTSLAQRGWGERIVPTFRPDALVHPTAHGWSDKVAALGEVTGIDTGTYDRYLDALASQRERFVAAGARASDHGHVSAAAEALDPATARRIYDASLRGAVTEQEAAAFSGHMLVEMARMSTQDGLVMQLHPGVLRDHHGEAYTERGPDIGYDIPAPTDFTHALRPLLNEFGRDNRLRLILFTVDEDTYSRELAPLAGVYPSVKLGAPWWFLDTPGGMMRFREAVTDTAGFFNTTGFVDDTRAFFTVPARHDLARRIDAGFLARLVAEHRLDLDEAFETANELAVGLAKRAYERTV
ncbi:glucuronate isomerase [Demequina sp. TTPB684]|uniref:glucuronate isomerase n=1 Tax=unclassified Demequina TaxID=2620311 RepID=UPI001CF282C0|nr:MULTISPECIES: glucuronate isomerase [unclassified Demequina]MCB2413369.1 glucuronate isomerase [Demequina sp. TTPB684]UPU87382.1 glucuronate isomerase [Demequina sp. TMPB413]